MTTKEQVLENLRGFVEKCHDRKIVCLDNDAPPVFINCVECDEDDEFWRYTLTRDVEGKLDMTVDKLIECLTDDLPDDPDPKGEETDVLVRLEEDKYSKYLDNSSDGIFFEYTVGGEKVIAFRCGDVAETDYDFFEDVD